MVTGIIMAGGKGERFWPKSRLKMPKQFLNLFGTNTLIQQTFIRLKTIIPVDNIYVVTCSEYAEIISDQLPELPCKNILIEPFSNNTAPCIGLAAIYSNFINNNSTMVVLPSDHIIIEDDLFTQTINNAISIVESNNCLMTIGVNPDRPETGYGYIKCSKTNGNNIFYKVDKFIEKPDINKAKAYYQSGDYLWNSGIFIWKSSDIISEISKHIPELYTSLLKIKNNFNNTKLKDILLEEYSNMPNISIDYGVLEKSDNVFVIPGNFGWDDIGSWNALDRLLSKDNFNNIISGNVVSFETKNSIISGNDRLIATIGVEDLIIIDSFDTIMVCHKDKTQNIKDLLQKLKNDNTEKYL